MKGKDIKEFTLGAVKWTVKFDNDRMSERKAIGTASFTESTIYLADKHDGIDIPPDLIDQVFYHELTHSIFDALGYEKLCDNEKLVQSIGLLLHQFETTKR